MVLVNKIRIKILFTLLKTEAFNEKNYTFKRKYVKIK